MGPVLTSCLKMKVPDDVIKSLTRKNISFSVTKKLLKQYPRLKSIGGGHLSTFMNHYYFDLVGTKYPHTTPEQREVILEAIYNFHEANTSREPRLNLPRLEDILLNLGIPLQV